MTPLEVMISMSRGARIGRSLVEDSPLEAPVGGHNRYTSLMNPATREMVLKARTQDIEKFAESRQLNTAAVLGVAEAAMRLGRVPDLRQYGFSGDDAKAIKHFVAGDVLNIAIEQLDAMDTIHEAMTDRNAANTVRQLSQAGAEILLRQKTERHEPGYDKALKALAKGDLLTVRDLLGENLVALGAAKALVAAMNMAPADVREAVQIEATQANAIASYMNLGTAMTMSRPRTMVNADQAERTEAERAAFNIGPRLGASPFESDIITLERMARLANEAAASATPPVTSYAVESTPVKQDDDQDREPVTENENVVMIFGRPVKLDEGTRGIGKLERKTRAALSATEKAQLSAVDAKIKGSPAEHSASMEKYHDAKKKSDSIYANYQQKGEHRAARLDAGMKAGKYRNLPPDKKMVFGRIVSVGRKSK